MGPQVTQNSDGVRKRPAKSEYYAQVIDINIEKYYATWARAASALATRFDYRKSYTSYVE